MEIKIFEETVEITCIPVRSAQNNRAIADKEIARQKEKERIKEEKKIQEEERIKKEKEQIKKENEELSWISFIKEGFPLLMEAINKRAEQGKTMIQIEWDYDESAPFNIPWNYREVIFERLRSVLEELGYKFPGLRFYSRSWTYKSGRLGWTQIHW